MRNLLETIIVEMKTKLLTLSLLLLCSNLIGQTNPAIDSLVKKGKNLLNSDLEKSLEYSYKAYHLSKNEDYYWGKMNAAQWIAEGYYYQSNFDSVSKYHDIALSLSKAENDQPEIANNLVSIGQVLSDKGNKAEALEKFKEARVIMESLKDTSGLTDVFVRQANIYLDIDDLDEAMRNYNISLEFAIARKDSFNIGGNLMNIATIQKKIGKVDKAIELTNEALVIFEKQNIPWSIFSTLVNRGILYKDEGSYDKALESYERAISFKEQMEYEPYEMAVSDNKGILLNLMGDYKGAQKALERTIALAQKLGIRDTESDAKSHLARSLHNLGRKKEAKKLLVESVSLAKQAKSLDKQREAHNIAIELYKKDRDLAKVLYHTEALNVVKDSIFAQNQVKEINNLQTKYETAKKDAAIKLLNANAELDKTKRLGLLAGLILLTITAVAVVFSLLQKRKREKLIFEQEKEIETVKRLQAEQELEFKKKELTAKVLQLARKNEFLGSLENEIQELKNNVDEKVTKTSSRIVRLIQRDSAENKEWEQFGAEFSSVHQGFFEKLQEKHGSFTQSETRLISLLKMNLSSKDIADTLRISDEGIKKARYRLRKKLGLNTDDDLQGYLASIS